MPLPNTIEELGYKSADPLERVGFMEEQLRQGKEQLTKMSQGFKTGALVPQTTLSSANIIEKVIPEDKERLKRLSQTGQYTDETGTQRYADGEPIPQKNEDDTFLSNLAAFNKSIGRSSNDATGIKKLSGGTLDTSGVEMPEGGVTSPEEDYDQQQFDLINQMKATLDAQTKRFISSIEQQYIVRKQQQGEIDRRQQEGIEQTLLIGGSSRYAQVSSQGITAAKERESLMNIAELDAEEKELINTALSAQESGDFKIMGLKLDLIEKKRAEKQKIAEELSKTITEENKKLKERQIQVSRDSAVAGLIAQGINDPVQMLEYLNYDDKGNLVGDFTAKEINEALQSLTGDKKITSESYSQDIKDFNYLSSLPDRGGIPDEIQNPIQYKRYIKELEQEIKNTGKTPSSTGIAPTDSPRGTPEQGSITSLEDIDKLDVSDVTKAVMAGYIGMKELTPTDKTAVAADLYRVGFNPKQYINRKLEGLVALYSAIPENFRGPVEAYVTTGGFIQNPKASTFESARQVLTRELARLNDVGVLSDYDVASYEAAMPSRRDKDIVQVIAKLSGLQLATGGKVSGDAGKTGTLADGREFVVGVDGETLLDPNTGEPLE